ncbi:MAG: molybdopterin-dependent oxidoreductase [Deltaproteobacteria bacterium]|nr:molybdopterin-dependent oxidoreductase [Deltaproteobacteria bacterium]
MKDRKNGPDDGSNLILPGKDFDYLLNSMDRRTFLKVMAAAPVIVLPQSPAGPDKVPKKRKLAKKSMPKDGMAAFKVNHKEVSLTVDPYRPLLNVLREELSLTGAKCGCGQGFCGACTVLVDDVPVRSCITPVGLVDGRRVMTIEGLADDDQMIRLQNSFMDCGALQCGFCSPGFMVEALALLIRNPRPTMDDIMDALDGHYCRCTGYNKIIKAVRVAAFPGERRKIMSNSKYFCIGSPYLDVTGLDKAAGKLRYAADHTTAGTLWGKILWSAHPRAKITSMSTKPSFKVPGVLKVITAWDLPAAKLRGPIIQDQPVLADVQVNCLSDPIVLVLAETAEAAAKGADAVKVDYEVLDPVVSPWEALKPTAPKLHEGGNTAEKIFIQRGDINAGMEQGVRVLESDYRTQRVEHAYLETEAAMSWLDPQGRVCLMSASQAPHQWQAQIAAMLGAAPDAVRVVTTPAGGAFGGKADLTIQHLCAIGTAQTKRPVKISLTREESIQVHPKRHPMTIHHALAAGRDGQITGVRAMFMADTGPYLSHGRWVAQNAAFLATGPYRVPNLEVEMVMVYTNNPISGTMRGAGSAQAVFAVESQMDQLAKMIGWDPLDFRIRNALVPGDKSGCGQIMPTGFNLVQCLELLSEKVRRDILPTRTRARREGRFVGVGYGAAYLPVGLGRGLDLDATQIGLRLTDQGKFEMIIPSTELGQGVISTLSQIAAETLSVNPAEITVTSGDTGSLRQGPPTMGAKETYITGRAVENTARLLAANAIALVVKVSGGNPEDYRLTKNGPAKNRGNAPICTWTELAGWAQKAGQPLVSVSGYAPDMKTGLPPENLDQAPPDFNLAPSFVCGAQAALVEAFPDDGGIKVLKVLACHDVGRMINPLNVEAQVEGGVMMGLGYALSEELVVEKGRIVTKALSELGVPTLDQAVEIDITTMEVPDERGPFGAKSLGEITFVPTAPAIINALADATGIRVTSLPASLEKVGEKIHNLKKKR